MDRRGRGGQTLTTAATVDSVPAAARENAIEMPAAARSVCGNLTPMHRLATSAARISAGAMFICLLPVICPRG